MKKALAREWLYLLIGLTGAIVITLGMGVTAPVVLDQSTSSFIGEVLDPAP